MFLLCRDDGDFCRRSQFDRKYYKFFADLNKTLSDENKIPKLTPHKCRHTFATYLLRNGSIIRYVQQLLGHSQIETTTIYTTVDIDDLKANITRLKY